MIGSKDRINRTAGGNSPLQSLVPSIEGIQHVEQAEVPTIV